MNTLISRSYPTPVGPLTVIADGSTVVAAGFCRLDTLRTRIPNLGPVSTVASIEGVDEAVADYLSGDIDALDRVNGQQAGTDLQQQVWKQLRLIPAGTTWSYRQLADAIGRPDAARAVGSACGRNRIAPFVPCHRALRSDGSLGGYAYGLQTKRWLLDHEAR